MNITLLLGKVERHHAGEATGHDFEHLQRVLANARKILADFPDADRAVVEAAALLHDVPDHKLVPRERLPEALALMRRWLAEAGASRGQAESVLHICTNLSFSSSATNEPLGVEGLIVQDADRLDAIGAVGIARAFAYGGAKGRQMYCENPVEGPRNDTVSHFYHKILRLKDLMNTDAGRRMARRRHAFTEAFLAEFLDEVR